MSKPIPTVRPRPGILKRVREIHRISSDEVFAQALGVSRATYDRVNREGAAPSPYFMAALVRFTGLGLGELFEVTDNADQATAA